MSAIFTKNFGVLLAKNFETDSTNDHANTFIAIGRQSAWSNGDSVPTPVDTSNSVYDLWNNLIGIKRLNASDMNLVVPRVDWTSGTVYVEYNQDTQLFAKANTANVAYDNKFYVRNTTDQVFKCLFNNSSASSTVMPSISIDGQLPENAYIITSDGYKWKYLYTIPAGLKEKFFTSEYMPIVSEPIVTNSAVDGRLDIIKISTRGAGYNANGNSNSYAIFTVVGDGSNANITAVVSSTAANGANIIGYNIINAGTNYSRAVISINDPLKIANTQTANVVAVIGPPGGHGSSIERELGASDLMICGEIEGSESGVLPINGSNSQYRQIAIIRDPVYAAHSNYANGSVYRVTNKYNLTVPNKPYVDGEIVYVGTSLATATFTGVVESYDSSSYYLYLNNLTGSVTAPATIYGNTTGATATILSIDESDIKKFSGQLLYIDNSAKITRDSSETQQIKLTLRF
jgi:hypothetical protein